MLDKFNNLFNKIIFEQVQADEEYNTYIQNINDYDAFFHAYIEPLAQKIQVQAIKARYNVFRIYGLLKNVVDFFNKFKVDKQFIKDSSKFQLLNPIICLCQNEHRYNKIYDSMIGGIGTEGETLNTYLEPNIQTFNNNEFVNKNIYGIWHNLIDYTEVKADISMNEQQKTLTPKQTANKILAFIKVMNNKNQDIPVYIEFMVNVDKLPNNSFEELAKAVPITNGNNTLSDVINNRPDVINPQPNQNVLGTIDTSKEQPLTKENNKQVYKNIKRKTTNFDNKNKVKTKYKTK